MAVKYGKLEIPSTIAIDEKTITKTFARFIAEPFERGAGHTVGNSLRRMIFLSIEAPAIVSVRLEGVPHEYMAIDGVVEDMVNIILNLKGALLRKLPLDTEKYSRDMRIITNTIEVTQEQIDAAGGQYEVKLGDIIKESNYDIVNPDLRILTVTKPIKKQIDLRVAFGRGYVPSERHEIMDKSADEILIDAAFSPVKLVNYYVENTRVGQDTDFDKLILEVTTDGRVTPAEAISFSSQIILKHFKVFQELQPQQITYEKAEEIEDTDTDELMEKLATRIDEIELSVRSTNCLSGANIETIGELVTIPERKMLEFRNFGKKSLNEIKAKLQSMKLHLGMDLTRYNITPDNVKDKIVEFLKQKSTKIES